jgi:diguanylate cyclase (GGDEF)-like protein
MNRQLLIIDDDSATHDLVAAHLANVHTRCIFALNGPDGVQRAVQSKPSAILLDMNMPGMDGMDVCRRLKADPQTREIPILFLTGDRTAQSKVKGIELGAVDYLTKPFDPLELRARVRSVFRTIHTIESAHALAGIDPATGLWNRAFVFKQIEAFVATAARARQMLSCCLLSIDRFDELAEKTGQPGGTDLIRDAAERMSAAVRPQDAVCRYDADTLAVFGIVPDRATSQMLADRLRSRIGEIGLRSFVEPELVTCSIGLVTSCASAGSVILRTAERAIALAELQGNATTVLDADSVAAEAGSQSVN